jgi:hypothetical protein
MTALERLRQLAAVLPPGASVTLDGAALAELLAEPGGAEQPEPAAELMTVQQLAHRFQRAPSTVRGWLEAGRFPGAYRLRGRDWRVPSAAAAAFEATEQGGPVLGTVPTRGALDDWRKLRARRRPR